MSAEPTGKKQRGRPFGKGCSGNPKGRPKGSRNKLAEDFIAAIYNDWQRHGARAVAAVRQTDPAAYLRVVSGLMPRDMLLRMEQAPVPPTEISPELESLLRQVIDGVPKRRGIGVNAHAGEPRAPAIEELLPDPIGQSKILN